MHIVSMAPLPRLQSAPEWINKKQSSSKPSKSLGRPSAAASNSKGDKATAATLRLRAEREEELKQQLAREEEILSLLTALNKPVMNEELQATLQAVKAHLYARNYSAAFGQPVSKAPI